MEAYLQVMDDAQLEQIVGGDGHGYVKFLGRVGDFIKIASLSALSQGRVKKTGQRRQENKERNENQNNEEKMLFHAITPGRKPPESVGFQAQASRYPHCFLKYSGIWL